MLRVQCNIHLVGYCTFGETCKSDTGQHGVVGNHALLHHENDKKCIKGILFIGIFFYLFQHCSSEMIHCNDIHHKKFKQGVLKNNCLIFFN